MKKIIFSIIIYSMSTYAFSQQKTFDYYEINNNVFKNKPYKIGLEKEAETVPLFEINLPNIDIKDINLMTSSIIYEIKFKSNSKIFIVGNISESDVDLKSQIDFNRKNLKNTIYDNALEDILYSENYKIWIKSLHPKNGLKIKKNRVNSLVQKKEFIIFYFNVKKEDMKQFNKSINSFKII